jgi:hypothetical protein
VAFSGPLAGQTHGSAATDAGMLQLGIEFVSSVRKRIGIKEGLESIAKILALLGVFNYNCRFAFSEERVWIF